MLRPSPRRVGAQKRIGKRLGVGGSPCGRRTGRLPEIIFASRVQALETRLTELRATLAELRDSARPVEVPSAAAVSDAEQAVRDAMLNGTPGQRKALLKELIVEVRVEGRDSIIPTYRLPTTTVRVTETMVGRDGLEPLIIAVQFR